MGEWSNLTQREKSNIIRFAIKNGVSDINTIRDTFNVYAKDSLANVDYNMAAAKASGFGSNGNGHYPDTFKKPNHPTFSDESIYHSEATPGGRWRGNTYEPSDFVLNQQGGWNQFLRGFYGQEQSTGAVPVFNGGVMLPEVTVTPQYKEGVSIHIKPSLGIAGHRFGDGGDEDMEFERDYSHPILGKPKLLHHTNTYAEWTRDKETGKRIPLKKIPNLPKGEASLEKAIEEIRKNGSRSTRKMPYVHAYINTDDGYVDTYKIPVSYGFKNPYGDVTRLESPVVGFDVQPAQLPKINVSIPSSKAYKSSTKVKAGTPVIPITDNRPRVTLSEKQKEGLAFIDNGKPYYTFEGYSPDDIDAVIHSIFSNDNSNLQINDDIYYEEPAKTKPVNNEPLLQQDTNSVNETSSGLKSSSNNKTSVDKADSVSKALKKITTETDATAQKEPTVKDYNTDEATFMYGYPRKIVHTYQMSPEIAEIVREQLLKLGAKNNNSNNEKLVYVGSPLPITTANDTVFHNLFIPSKKTLKNQWAANADYDEKSQIMDVMNYKTFEAALASGNILPIGDSIFVTSSATNNKSFTRKVPNTDNLYLLRSPYATFDNSDKAPLYTSGIVTSGDIKQASVEPFKYYDYDAPFTGKVHSDFFRDSQGNIVLLRNDDADAYLSKRRGYGSVGDYTDNVVSWKATIPKLDRLESISKILNKGNKKSFAEGGSIRIKPSKRGTFTAAATKHGKSVQEFARQVLANKENYSPAMVKKANFARNAAGWKHSTGGPLYPFSFQKNPYWKTPIVRY